MIGRIFIFFIIALIGVTLPWYSMVAALAVAVVLYEKPYEFIVLGFIFDELAMVELPPRHHLVITITLLLIYIATVVVRDRLRVA